MRIAILLLGLAAFLTACSDHDRAEKMIVKGRYADVVARYKDRPEMKADVRRAQDSLASDFIKARHFTDAARIGPETAFFSQACESLYAMGSYGSVKTYCSGTDASRRVLWEENRAAQQQAASEEQSSQNYAAKRTVMLKQVRSYKNELDAWTKRLWNTDMRVLLADQPTLKSQVEVLSNKINKAADGFRALSVPASRQNSHDRTVEALGHLEEAGSFLYVPLVTMGVDANTPLGRTVNADPAGGLARMLGETGIALRRYEITLAQADQQFTSGR